MPRSLLDPFVKGITREILREVHKKKRSQGRLSRSSQAQLKNPLETIKPSAPCPHCGGEVEPYKTVPRGKCTGCGKRFQFEVEQPRVTSASSSGCFIATEIYGSELAYEVLALRKWRDNHLGNSGLGRRIIEFYYRNGPYIALWIRDKLYVKRVARVILDSFIRLCLDKHSGE